MFSEYFSKQADALEKALIENLGRKGLQTPQKEKDLGVFQEFYTFLKDHIPADFSLATGKVRNRKHLLNRNGDVLVYKKWAPKLLEMTGGYVLADALHAFITLESELSPQALATHANLTRALKTLYAGEEGPDQNGIIPMYSILFAYGAGQSLAMLKKGLRDFTAEKDIALNLEPDLIVVLGKGLIIKDWESGGDYRIIETGEDTLMWFYILFIEYIDRDERLNLNLRDYVKTSKEYREY